MLSKIKPLISDAKSYWKKPMPGRFMPFKEIAAYSGGGIGAYMIITLGTACLLATGNTLLSSTLAVDATDMYILYVIAILINIPLTGIRATIIDNTRNKAGKYRPYIVTMAIPTTIICIAMVWFPYDKLGAIVGHGQIFGESAAYVAKCAIILVLNILLHFFYYFFYDSYENLIHVLSPDSQERTDVASIKSVVYSLAPTLVNLFTPIIAQHIFHTNTTDIRVYRFLYPLLGVLGILLCLIVYKHTEEKIIQAKTHVIQIKFTDALRAVAGNKYFWIISLAGWLGFLEMSFANILFWLYNYGGACTGDEYGLIITLYGNASLWGMLLAPFCIRRWGKKAVLVVTNIFNIVFILLMLPVTNDITKTTIWMVMACLYFNALMGSFAHILNPAIQADIRDYQQYKTGERIDGMFATVTTIGNVVTLVTSSVLPMIYERGGITKENAAVVTSNPNILNRILGDGKTVGEILTEQLANGQDNFNNAYSALYDPDILISLLHVLIIVSAFGAAMNVLPYFWYDFNEKKQKSIIRVLRVRALFEDYGNGVLKDKELVDAIDLIRDAREKAALQAKEVSKNDYKSVKGKQEKKAAKKAYREALKYNEEIEISKFVCQELDKFSSELTTRKLEYVKGVYASGLEGLKSLDLATAKAELNAARQLPTGTPEEKEYRKFAIGFARNKVRACKTIIKYYKDKELEKPDFTILDEYLEKENECDEALKSLYIQQAEAKKQKDSFKLKEISDELKSLKKKKAEYAKKQKEEMDRHAFFSRAAKPYLDAERLFVEKENNTHFDEIEAKYEQAKINAEAEEKAKLEEEKRLEEEKAAAKAEKKNK